MSAVCAVGRASETSGQAGARGFRGLQAQHYLACVCVTVCMRVHLSLSYLGNAMLRLYLDADTIV